MKTETCPTEETLQGYIFGNVDDTIAIATESHVDTCSECQSRLEAFMNEADPMVEQLRSLRSDSSSQEQTVSVSDLSALIDTSVSLQANRETINESLADDDIRDLFEQNTEYVLTKRIGAGGMGEVWRGIHRKLQKDVAIKMIRHDRKANKEFVERFLREMRTIGSLDHPHVVRATDAGELNGVLYLVMEFIDGIDVGKLARSRGGLPVKEAAEIIRQAALGLDHIHQQGILHRDLKPSNLMVTKSGAVKILDAGLARWQESEREGPSLTGSGNFIGTPDYMSPEQWTEPDRLTPASDVYALGCTLYCLLNGHAPFATNDHSSIGKKMDAHRHGEVPKLNHISGVESVAPVLERMLEKCPRGRIQSSEEVAEKLSLASRGADLAIFSMRQSSTSASQDGDALAPESIGTYGQTRILLYVGFAAFIAVLITAVSMVFRSPQGTFIIELADDSLIAKAVGETLVIEDKTTGREYRLTIRKQQHETSVPAGEYLIHVSDDSGLDLETKEFRIEKNGTRRVRVIARRDGIGHDIPDQIDGIHWFDVKAIAPDYPVTDLAWQPDSNRLAVCSITGDIRIVDAQTGEVIQFLSLGENPTRDVISRPVLAAWSPDGSRFAAGFAKHSSFNIWSASGKLEATATLRPTPDGQNTGLFALAWSPDSRQIAVSLAKSVGLYHSDGTLVREFGAGENISHLDWTHDGKSLLLARYGDEASFTILDVKENQEVSVFPLDMGIVNFDVHPTDNLAAIALFDRGRNQASLQVIDFSDAEVVNKKTINVPIRDGQGMSAVCWNHDGTNLVIAADGLIRVQSQRDELVASFPISGVSALAYSQNERYLMAYSNHPNLRLQRMDLAKRVTLPFRLSHASGEEEVVVFRRTPESVTELMSTKKFRRLFMGPRVSK